MLRRIFELVFAGKKFSGGIFSKDGIVRGYFTWEEFFVEGRIPISEATL